MTKDKRLLPAILYITVFVLLIIFLAGQCLIVGMFGPNGSYIKLGLNGYPDYIGLMQVASSNIPNIAADNNADDLFTIKFLKSFLSICSPFSISSVSKLYLPVCIIIVTYPDTPFDIFSKLFTNNTLLLKGYFP